MLKKWLKGRERGNAMIEGTIALSILGISAITMVSSSTFSYFVDVERVDNDQAVEIMQTVGTDILALSARDGRTSYDLARVREVQEELRTRLKENGMIEADATGAGNGAACFPLYRGEACTGGAPQVSLLEYDDAPGSPCRTLSLNPNACRAVIESFMLESGECEVTAFCYTRSRANPPFVAIPAGYAARTNCTQATGLGPVACFN